MIGLLPDRPQRGESGLRDLERVAKAFDALFAKHCEDVPQGRPTGEKALQSHLISEAYQHDRRLVSINAASKDTDHPVELTFITDEIPVPTETGRIVCDLLALRVDGGRSTPVLLELKDARMLKRLVEQVDAYADLIDEHAESFERLYTAVLGETVEFDAETERWIVWPAAGPGADPREGELAKVGIRVVSYTLDDGGYSFEVGIDRPRCSTCRSPKDVVPVIHGEPTPQAGERAERGEVIIAGCMIDEDSRPWRCRGCGEDFGSLGSGTQRL